jgi:hypothetical protein
VQSAPAGFTVEISLDNGATYTIVTTNTLNLPLNQDQKADILVRVTAPAGTNVLEENGFPVVIRATSTLTPTAYNETIDRFYTGFLRMDKTATVINNTGVGSTTDAVPGAIIEYAITYRNISGGERERQRQRRVERFQSRYHRKRRRQSEPIGARRPIRLLARLRTHAAARLWATPPVRAF